MFALTYAAYSALKLLSPLGLGPKEEGEPTDVGSAVGRVGYTLSDRVFVLGKGLGGVEAEKRHASNAVGVNGSVTKFAKTENALGAHSAVLASAEQGEKVTVFTDSSSLVPLIATIQDLKDSHAPVVFHVAASEVDVLNVHADGTVILASQTAQEAYDLSIAATVIARVTKTPVIHFHDGQVTAKSPVRFIAEEKLKDVLEEESVEGADVWEVVDGIFERLSSLLGRRYCAFEYFGAADAKHVVIAAGVTGTVVAETAAHLQKTEKKSVGVLAVRVVRPWSATHAIEALPATAQRIAVLQGGAEGGWGPLYLDVVASVHTVQKSWANGAAPAVASGNVEGSVFSPAMAKAIFDSLSSSSPKNSFVVGPDPSALQGKELSAQAAAVNVTDAPQADNPYVKMLHQLFRDRLEVANEVGQATVWGQGAQGSVEYGYGVHLANIQRRAKLAAHVTSLLADKDAPASEELRSALSDWLAVRDDARKVGAAAGKAQKILEVEGGKTDALADLTASAQLLNKPSRWLIGSDDWARDVGDSGIHHVISSGEDVNVLVIDTQPYSLSKRNDFEKFKRDIGLYAMNYGGCYVASVAVYSSYTQAIKAFQEADAFVGPSIVLAYLPEVQATSESVPLEMLKETKKSVDAGLWPLYRWNPKLEEQGKECFSLDSVSIKKSLSDFLERHNNLSQLAKEAATYAPALAKSTKTVLEAQHVAAHDKAAAAFAALAGGLNSEPLLVLFGSDTGNGEGVARHLASGASLRGLSVRCMAAEEFAVDDLPLEPNVIFVVSTAGQGEFPANSKEFWKGLQSATTPLNNTRFSVFALGDSHYWPRPEEKIYFAKPGRDLDERLEVMGGQRMVALGLGDDQHEDGYWTSYKEWEPEIWKALGVDKVQVGEGPAKKTDDDMKRGSNFLRGTILEGLADTSTGALCETDTKLTKFHGIYQQDDRDLREERRKQGLEKAFSFMIRVRVPGGVSTAAQWLAMDALCDSHANGTIKLTTRQAYQLHGVIKRNLKPAIQAINAALMDTLAACGDVNRNVMCNPNPFESQVHAEVDKFARDLSAHLSPRTSAYHEIWLDQKPVGSSEDVEPLYGPTYLPRKFKIAICIPPNNDVDVFAHCLGYIAIVENGKLVGYNVTVGGGMGMTHNNKKTYPCLAQVLGFCTPEQAIDVGEKVMLVQRDYGDRTNRKHARLKYTVDDRGIEWYRNEVETRCGYKLQAPREYKLTNNSDRYGWTQGEGGNWHYCLYVTNGRVLDTPDLQLKTGLREIAKVHTGDFRLTANQNVIIGNITPEQKPVIENLLRQYNLGNDRFSGMRLNSMACVALPTCSLAFAESERYLPALVTKIEATLEEAGLRDDAITIRMTGCPNGCARPYVAEIAMVGRASGVYNLYLGAGHAGERLNKIYREAVNEEQILNELRPVIFRYAKERLEGGKFGDFVIRAGIIKATRQGKDFHEV
eukprot:comp24292_c0_seq1/m.45500 comp24292_c0_seq1/g.45500  ORF comp24292_c0_seq1/g.45500 comp24292_c0_seq1/m.45500 type:complete len:1448 (-) comp24292_c0_seq1:355-4698(-)